MPTRKPTYKKEYEEFIDLKDVEYVIYCRKSTDESS